MKKVILKCKVSGRERFEGRLNALDLDFSPIYWQHDRVYLPRGYKSNMNLPRMIMRTEIKSVDKPAKYFLILKRHIEDSGVDVVEETLVKDYVEMVKIILQLGFKPRYEVSRRRQEIKMGENTMLYLDKVEGIEGYYSKIETKLDENEPVQKTQSDLRKTFMALGESNFIEKTYADLMGQ